MTTRDHFIILTSNSIDTLSFCFAIIRATLWIVVKFDFVSFRLSSDFMRVYMYIYNFPEKEFKSKILRKIIKSKRSHTIFESIRFKRRNRIYAQQWYIIVQSMWESTNKFEFKSSNLILQNVYIYIYIYIYMSDTVWK